mgnify:CR=1 FL=1
MVGKIYAILGSIIVILIVILSIVWYNLIASYKVIAQEQVKVQECITSLEDLNRAIAKSNAALKQLEIQSKNYKYSRDKLKAELDKIYESYTGATTCQGIITNVDKSFQLMIERLHEVESTLQRL